MLLYGIPLGFVSKYHTQRLSVVPRSSEHSSNTRFRISPAFARVKVLIGAGKFSTRGTTNKFGSVCGLMHWHMRTPANTHHNTSTSTPWRQTLRPQLPVKTDTQTGRSRASYSTVCRRALSVLARESAYGANATRCLRVVFNVQDAELTPPSFDTVLMAIQDLWAISPNGHGPVPPNTQCPGYLHFRVLTLRPGRSAQIKLP